MDRKILTRLLVCGVALVGVPATTHVAFSRARVELVASGAPTGSRATARISMLSASRARFEIRASGLVPEAACDLVVAGVRVAKGASRKSGRLRFQFADRSVARWRWLGFDPRGQTVEVLDAEGTTLFHGVLPETETDDEAAASGGPCDSLPPADCGARGGSVSGASSCLPDPCGPLPATSLVCCLPQDTSMACGLDTVPMCLDEDGLLVEAAGCDDDPCSVRGTCVEPPSTDSWETIPGPDFSPDYNSVFDLAAGGGELYALVYSSQRPSTADVLHVMRRTQDGWQDIGLPDTSNLTLFAPVYWTTLGVAPDGTVWLGGPADTLAQVGRGYAEPVFSNWNGTQWSAPVVSKLHTVVEYPFTQRGGIPYDIAFAPDGTGFAVGVSGGWGGFSPQTLNPM